MAKRSDNLPRDAHWLVFVANLPIDDPAARMRLLRTLESLGCAVLREGVYLLPDSIDNRQSLARMVEHVARLNGSAHVLAATALDELQGEAFRGFFDRTAKYEELIQNVKSISAAYGISDPGSISRVLAKHRRDFDAITTLDFFPSEAKNRAAKAIREADEQIRSLMFPDVQQAAKLTQSGRHYLRRIWATRKPLWADRLASAWLIRRFIDPEATVIWLEKSQACPSAAIGFGFDGAHFFNSKSRVTFEELVSSFDLHRNATLMRLGALVHFLDAGGTPVPEAAGVETLLQGALRRSSNDDELFAETEKTFDLLYDAYFEPTLKG